MKLKALSASLLLALVLTSAGAARAEGCSNERVREESRSTLLPDCRAYEMVSPLDKNGGDVSEGGKAHSGGVIESSPDGNKVTYGSLTSFGTDPGSSPAGSQYLASRQEGGWDTENVTRPAHAPNYTVLNAGTQYKAFTPDLTEALVINSNAYDVEVEDPPIGGAPQGYRDYYLHNFKTNADRALIMAPPPESPAIFNSTEFLVYGDAVTPDLRHVILKSSSPLVPGVTAGENLFEWSEGRLQPVDVAPGAANGQTLASDSTVLGHKEGLQSRTVSDDGSRVFWTAPIAPGSGFEDLYVREGLNTSQPTTVRVDASQGGTGDGQGVFQTASTTGSVVFFTSHERLTPDATTPENGLTTGASDLYEFDVDTGQLTDLTVDHSDPNGADVQGVLGASEDGSYVYFVASGRLASGATPDKCEASNPATRCNLYLWHAGAPLTFVAQLSSADEAGEQEGVAYDWSPKLFDRTARISPDGRHLVFVSHAQLTSYDNREVPEVYEYDAGSLGPVCLSCAPDGAATLGASSIPGGTPYGPPTSASYEPRVLSADGDRVFFNSASALVSGDTNHRQDVYEWERDGTGSCTSTAPGFSSSTDGCVSLISSGTGSEGASFADASENGSNVFFVTRQQLVPGDTDQEVDLYDAREDGGFTTPEETACTGTGCQGVPAAAPIFATPASGTFEGVGNFAPALAVKPAPKALTRAQKLAKALRACSRQPRRKQAACRKLARQHYGPPVKRRKR